MLNAVLGTQRGSVPGAMAYMYPMGAGVSKQGIPNAPQGHHWSDAEHHFWCCQGSGVEAFARLADSVFWRHQAGGVAASAPGASGGLGAAAAAEAGDLFVLQLVSARLSWKERATVVELQADEPGARLAGQPLVTRLRMSWKGGERGGAVEAAAAAMTVWVRVPGWATRVEVRCTDALTALRPPAAGRLLPLRFAPTVDSPRGELTLTLGAAVAWEAVSDSRPQMRSLLQASGLPPTPFRRLAPFPVLNASPPHRLSASRLPPLTSRCSSPPRHPCIPRNRSRRLSLPLLWQAPLYGPLVLVALTQGERALPFAAQLEPVPATARAQLASLRISPPPTTDATDAAGAAGAVAPGCLVTRRSIVTAPSLAAAHTATYCARGPPACSGLPSWLERRALSRLDAQERNAKERKCFACLPDVANLPPLATQAMAACLVGACRPLTLVRQASPYGVCRLGHAYRGRTRRLPQARRRCGAAVRARGRRCRLRV